MRELEAQAKALVPVVREYVKGVFDPLSKRLDEAEKRLKAVEAIEPPSVDEDSIVEKLFRAIPKPKDGENGKDADPVEVAKLVLAELPAPEPGKSVTVEDVRPLLEELVADLPKPADGKDADPEVIKRLVADAVAELPNPQDGKSVTVEDLAPVIDDQLAKAVAALPKPADGKSVPIEDVQRMVDEAVDKRMQALQLPKDGEPGRDAVDLEILPAIDESKSYARGTYAQHANGLWRAYERTHGMKGWECIVAGLAAIEITSDDDRQIAVKSVLSTGVVEHKTFQIPAMIYRGIFKPGMHCPGDTVTWGGSLWHCDEPTEDKPGEVGSKGWTLAAKRGRDGKDGRNGIDKTAAVKLP